MGLLLAVSARRCLRTTVGFPGRTAEVPNDGLCRYTTGLEPDMTLRPLTINITPDTPEEWLEVLNRARVGTEISDRDGDVWTKKLSRSDDGMTWIRTGGGWAHPESMVRYAPFYELD